MNKEQKNHFFQVLPIINLILAIMIIFHHVFNLNVDVDKAPMHGGILLNITYVIERYLYNLSECAVPIFYFISALLFYRNFDGTKKAYVTKIKSRLFSLALPYLIFNILGYIKHIVFSHKSFDFFDCIRSLIISDTVPLWFVRELMFLVILSPLIYQLRKKLPWGILLSGLCVIGVVVGIIPYRSFLYWFPIYFIGSLMSVHQVESIAQKISDQKFLTWSLFLLYLVFVWFLPNTKGNMNYYGNFIFISFRLFSIGFALFLVAMIDVYHMVVQHLGEYSFFIYCVHFPLITLIARILEKFSTSDQTLLVRYFVTFVLTFLLSIGFAQLLERATPQVWYILNGGRKTDRYKRERYG